MVKDQTKTNSEEPKPKEEKPDFETFKKDVAKYIRNQQATGKLPEDFDVENLSDAQKRELLTNYNMWVQEGKPQPQEPKPKEEKQDKILRVYRRRSFGEEKLTAVVDGEQVQMGIKLIPVYAKRSDGTPDMTNQIGTERKYTIEYTEAKARELVERCKKESPSPKLYLKEESGPTLRVKMEKNFFRPFDEIWNEALSGKPI